MERNEVPLISAKCDLLGGCKGLYVRLWDNVKTIAYVSRCFIEESTLMNKQYIFTIVAI